MVHAPITAMPESSEREKVAEKATAPPVSEEEGEAPRQIDFDFRGSWSFEEDATAAGYSLFLPATPSQQFYPDSSPQGPFPFLPTPPPPPPPPPPLPAEYAGDLLTGIPGGPLARASQGVDETVCENKSNNMMGNMSIFSTFLSEHSNASCSLKERISLALRRLKETTDQHGLFQVWVPVKNGNKHVLTTLGQPFVLDPHDTGLLQYRTVSLTYTFSVDGDRDDELGIPGRVFQKKTPEWTPNVQYYTSKEYPRLYHALNHNVQGTLALPIFEPSGQTCVGVIELIMMSPKINYAPEVDKVCKALETVNLRSSEVIQNPSFQICNEGRQAAFAEILEILTVSCEAYNLPLAQTWIPCRNGAILAQSGGSKKKCSSFDGSCMEQVCMSTTDMAFYVVDARMWGFRDACAEHHLQKGQGVTGRAYGLGRPCFSRDITQFCKIEYPLVHYARMFELASCIAIHLQSSYTGKDDYILEFFLPSNCRDIRKQDLLLEHIISKIQQCFRSLKIVGEMELQGRIVEIIKGSTNENHVLQSPAGNNSGYKKHQNAIAETEHLNFLHIALTEQHEVDTFPMTLFPTETDGENNDGKFFSSDNGQISGSLQVSKNTKLIERKRGKPEKFISLDVLQKYFSGSLKDAAKSLGVCPTTMKRICRQHGITRWPSRKINKVNTSLSKLKQVIESVRVADGAFNFTSLTNGDMSVGSFWPVNLEGLKQNSSGVKASDLIHLLREDTSPHKSSESEARYENISCQQEYAGNHCNGFQPEPIRDLNNGKTTCFREVSASNDASQSSSQESSANGDIMPGPSNFSIPEQDLNEDCKLESAFQMARAPSLLLPQWTTDARQREEPEQLQLPMQNSGRPIELSSLRSVVAETFRNEPEQGTLQTNHLSDIPAMGSRIIVVKANYKEDVIRFRMLSGAGFVALKEEVAARLKLETGTFDIGYMDDYHEWVMLSCDSDLEECIELSRWSGERAVRLSVRDLPSHLGSSCESSGEEFLRATSHST